MGIVRVEYAAFLIDTDRESIMQCINEISEAILKEESLKEYGYNIDSFY